MSLPTDIRSYEPEWMQLAYKLKESGEFLLPCHNPKLANYYRFRFYGFRKALAKHDAANPLISVLMETQAVVRPDGDLFFQRNHLATLLHGLLEHTQVVTPTAFQGSNMQDRAVGKTAMETTLLEVLEKHNKD